MNYFKVFFYVWKRSFSEAKYYKDVLKAPFAFSLKYFIFFCFLLTLVTTIYLSTKVFIPLNQFLARVPKVLTEVYPGELEIKISNGVMTTNVPQPYFIPFDRFEEGFEELEKEIRGISSDEIENILVIDTNARVEDLRRYQTYALLTRSYLSYYRDDGRIEIVTLDKINNFTLNQTIVKGVVSRLLPWLRLISIFLLPLLFIGIFLFFISSQLGYLLISSLALFLGAKIISYPLSYIKAYQVDLHLTTIITPFFLILSTLNIKVQFPFLKLFVFTLIGLYILNNLKGKTPRIVKVKKQSKRS